MVEYITDLLIEFDEMGFIPSTTCPNPEDFAKEWKRKLMFAVNRLKRETIQEIWKDIKDYNVGTKDGQKRKQSIGLKLILYARCHTQRTLRSLFTHYIGRKRYDVGILF